MFKRFTKEKESIYIPAKYYPTLSTQEVEKEVNGVVLRVIETIEIDPLSVNDGLKVQDFSLDVLINNNAVDLLRVSSPIKQTNLKVAATVENL